VIIILSSLLSGKVTLAALLITKPCVG